MPKYIDTHVHPPTGPDGPISKYEKALHGYWKMERPLTVYDMVATYKELDIFGVLLAKDDSSAQGDPPVTNDFVAGIAKKYPEQFVGVGSVDPWQGKLAVREIERAITELGLIGIKFIPQLQEFYLNEPRFYPMYAKCQELGVPIIVHSGTTGVGANMPGGGGIHLKYTKPIPYMDDVAADFPELTIIMAHPAFPWQDEQLAVLRHKPNVFMDLSGWSPKYYSPLLIQYANSLLQDKMFFGTDYPYLTPKRWLQDFQEAPFREEVRGKILHENARRILKLPV